MFTFLSRFRPSRRIYLDHAASTPTRPEVLKAMMPYFAECYGNPSAIHTEGREAKKAIEAARASVAETLRVRPNGIVFTSGGTEANALAIVGYLTRLCEEGRTWGTMEVVSTPIEHPSVMRTLAELTKRGLVVKTVPVDSEGFVTPAALEAVLTHQTVLVTMAYANSEIGVVQPVHSLARVLRAYERAHEGSTIAFHLDAAQAPLWLPCDLPRLGVDLLTLDGAKCGGPKGVGLLARRKGIEVSALLQGGGQEAGHRPGTENVAGIVGMGAAVDLAQTEYRQRAVRVSSCRDHLLQRITEALPQAIVNGPRGGEGRIANNINISLPGIDTEYAVVVLDTAGIAASTKSACAGAGSGVSTVVLALENDVVRARSTLRLTLGEDITTSDVAKVVSVLTAHVEKMRTLT